MTQSTTASQQRPRNPRPEKYAERKRELAQTALSTLAELGYARTSLRDIAKASGCSLGVIHYYFTDKVELIGYCVGLYKQDFVEDINRAVDSACSAEMLRRQMFQVLVCSVRDNPKEHRLWYDIRAQALFDETFRPAMWDIDSQIEAATGRFLSRLGELSRRPVRVDAGTAYALLDGLFQRYLLRHIIGEERACERFEKDLATVVDGMLG
ncbi:TetR/AcrR family transcriptional regulator [Mangrovitalea sediminis]|uniref:TetR/AcrR family transcriptional regulator n=1 Tax=Mangrovitalea sediminis TaxID=1982043 RepID=UPI0013042865|nr:TetR/AcrR family transcriptional regulator [Mangrovitalea sediminis]